MDPQERGVDILSENMDSHGGPYGDTRSVRNPIEEPYRHVARFIADDVQRSYSSADRLAKQLQRIIAGTEPPLENATGNAWTMDIDANVARLTCSFATPVSIVELPTAWLVAALERWLDHLIAKKRTP